jgi:hypothetical protein
MYGTVCPNTALPSRVGVRVRDLGHGAVPAWTILTPIYVRKDVFVETKVVPAGTIAVVRSTVF